jgi:hypothetical protein
MSYARINTLTFVSEEVANTMQAHYASTAPEGFPEAEILTFVRTGPVNASITSIYPDKVAFERSAEERNRRMKENEGKIASVQMQEGVVGLAHVKNK